MNEFRFNVVFGLFFNMFTILSYHYHQVKRGQFTKQGKIKVLRTATKNYKPSSNTLRACYKKQINIFIWSI